MSQVVVVSQASLRTWRFLDSRNESLDLACGLLRFVGSGSRIYYITSLRFPYCIAIDSHPTYYIQYPQVLTEGLPNVLPLVRGEVAVSFLLVEQSTRP